MVARSGQAKMITISTNLAGRGTDIRLGPGIAALGGLHVIVADCHESPRMTRQLIGRCGRQGEPGSSQRFISAEDPVVLRYGSWLAAFLRRYARSDGELLRDLSASIQRIQRTAERADFAARCALMRRDRSRDSLFAATSNQF